MKSKGFPLVPILIVLIASILAVPLNSRASDLAGSGKGEAPVITSVPRTMSYQAYLTDSVGNPINDTLSIEFLIYDTESGGTALWDETQSIELIEGNFSTELGLITPLNLSFDTQYYLELVVESEILDPRQRLNMVPYSASTDTSDFAAGIAENVVNSSSILDGSIQFSDIGQNGADSGEVMKWNGSAWVSANDESGGGSGGWIDDGAVLRLETDTDSVGIGTASPTEKVEVEGNIRINGKANLGVNSDNSGLAAFVAGYQDTASGPYSTVGGGSGNKASGAYSAVNGGVYNNSSGSRAYIGGGYNNTATVAYTTVAGGASNTASGDSSTVGGGAHNNASGDGSTISGGATNTANEYMSTIGGGMWNGATGMHSTVGGGLNNAATGLHATVSGGSYNRATGQNSVVAGGGGIQFANRNEASGMYSAIVGGLKNFAVGNDAFVGGGYENRAGGFASVVAGGYSDTANGGNSFVGGGHSNTVNGDYSAIVGGIRNYVDGTLSAVLFGMDDTITATANRSYLFGLGSKLTEDSTFMVDMPHIHFGDETTGYEIPSSDGASGQILSTDGAGQVSWMTVPGASASGWVKENNIVKLDTSTDSVGIGLSTPTEKLEIDGNIKASGTAAFGSSISVTGTNSFAAGLSNTVAGDYGTIGGGRYNNASGNDNAIAGGRNNNTSNDFSFVGGGFGNTASGIGSFIGSGQSNTASGSYSVANGYGNTATLGYTTVGGGNNNTAQGDYSTVPGGRFNKALGSYSFAAGQYAFANYSGSIVIAANSSFSPDSTRSGGLEQMVLRADGGLYITNAGGTAPYDNTNIITTTGGAYLSGAGNTWTNSSDRNKKENFEPVNRAELLEKIEALPINEWNYKTDDDNFKHIGPVAQDFHQIFGVGADSTSISTVDPSGVALAGIQALLEKIRELEAKITELEAERK